MKVTLWYMLNPSNKQYVYNHLEEGHSLNDAPLPKKDLNSNVFENQKFWKNQKWKKQHATLINNVVTVY